MKIIYLLTVFFYLPDGRGIDGNKYRLIVKFEYEIQLGYIRFVGTHKEYDNINAEEV